MMVRQVASRRQRRYRLFGLISSDPQSRILGHPGPRGEAFHSLPSGDQKSRWLAGTDDGSSETSVASVTVLGSHFRQGRACSRTWNRCGSHLLLVVLGFRGCNFLFWSESARVPEDHEKNQAGMPHLNSSFQSLGLGVLEPPTGT